MTEHIPELRLPAALSEAAGALSDKDRGRFDESIRLLHLTNARLWAREDAVRDVRLDAAGVADTKRIIDQLNMQRHRHGERVDEVLSSLAGPAVPDAVTHTEPLSSVLDRLSVLTLRLHHTGVAAERGEPCAGRLPALRAQARELAGALDTLVTDVRAGRRRLPAAERFKRYGSSSGTTEAVAPSPHIERVIALGGLSECGKSSSALYLQRAHGTVRFKIGYLLELAAVRRGLADPYSLSARRQAELLLEELNRFADAHVDARVFTIESVHSDTSIRELKALLGDRLCTVYLDAPFDVRVSRSAAGATAVRDKDTVKTKRGAHAVADLADALVDNSGSLLALRSRLTRLSRPALVVTPRLVEAGRLPLPTDVTDALGKWARAVSAPGNPVQLVAVTGSAATGQWLRDWSDLDLFVVADQDATPAIDQATATCRKALHDAIHIGVSQVTAGEISGGVLPPRLTFALHAVEQSGSALFAAPGFLLPCVTSAYAAATASGDLPLVMATARRLRADTDAPLRSLYKHLVLACRLLLLQQDVWERDCDRILHRATQLLPELGQLGAPSLTRVTTAHRDSNTAEDTAHRVRGALDRLLDWYSAQVAA